MHTTQQIIDKAAELGYERCGIIAVDKLKGYGDKVRERVARFPEMAPFAERFMTFADPTGKLPWAKSLVVCSRRYGVYRTSADLEGVIGKYYQVDERRNEMSEGFRCNAAFERFLVDELGLQVFPNRDAFLAPYRWAAIEAGLGTVRKNNFFYGDHGSYYYLNCFFIDADLEYIHAPAYRPCPPSCNLCAKNCPTGALAGPYAMNMAVCVTHLNTRNYGTPAYEKNRGKLGRWIYGCDACQDACPFNRDQWTNTKTFPELDEVERLVSPEKILEMDYGTLKTFVVPKFWYMGPDEAWKWKGNALNALANDFGPRLVPAIRRAAENDGRGEIREAARRLLERIETLQPPTRNA